jgi:hypothetical protein
MGHRYRNLVKRSADGLLRRACHGLIKTTGERFFARRRPVAEATRYGLLATLSRLTGRPGFLHRLRVVTQLARLPHRNLVHFIAGEAQARVSLGDGILAPDFGPRAGVHCSSLGVTRNGSGHVLRKDMPRGTGRDRAQLELGALELDLLRYLYRPRRWEQVSDAFGERLGEGELRALRDKHQAFGSLLAAGRWWMCVASDPGYWREGSAGEEAASQGIQTDLRPMADVAVARH